MTVDFQAAVRYAEQLGLEWNDETARAVNDYLTALHAAGTTQSRIPVFLESGSAALRCVRELPHLLTSSHQLSRMINVH